jgi:hypothetical protein
VDRLYDIDVIIGARNGNSMIQGGNRGIEIHALGDNNVLIGGLGNNVIDGGSGANNTLDYSGAAGSVDVNLNNGVAAHNGSGFVDQITGIQRIVGSNASGNLFEGKDGTNDWIDVGTGKNDKIFGSVGNDTYVSHDASNTLDYSKLTAGINFGTVAGVVQKGANGTDTLVGTFGNLIGTNYNDIIVVSGAGTVQAGGGDDIIRLTGGNAVQLRAERHFCF